MDYTKSQRKLTIILLNLLQRGLPFNNDNWHLDKLQRALSVFKGLTEVQDLTSHYAHLFFEKVAIETFVRLAKKTGLEQVVLRQTFCYLLHDLV